MTDITEDVARAIAKACAPKMNGMFMLPVSTEVMANAAIRAARPHIEREYRERLIAAAESQGVLYVSSGYADSTEERMDFEDWISAQDGAQ